MSEPFLVSEETNDDLYRRERREQLYQQSLRLAERIRARSRPPPPPENPVGTVVRGISEVPLKFIAGGVEAFTADPLDLLGDLAGLAGFESADDTLDQAAQATRDFIAGVTGGEATTPLGRIALQAGNFAAAFLPVLGGLRAVKGGAALTKSGLLAEDLAAGAIADFLTADTDQSEDLGKRLKEAGIGAASGAALGMTMGFLRSVRSARIQRLRSPEGLEQQAIEAAERRLGRAVIPEQELRISGDAFEATDDILVRLRHPLTADPQEIARASARRKTLDTARATAKLNRAVREVEAVVPRGTTPEQVRALAAVRAGEIDLNLDRIDSPDAVKQLMDDATQLLSDSVDRARRGTISNETTLRRAMGQDLALEDLLNRRTGQALNAERTMAFRMVWTSAAERVSDLAEAASRPGATTADLYRFRRGLATFHAINKEVMGARAEAGRALQAWSIRVSGDELRARQVADLIDAAGGDGVSLKLAQRITAMKEAGALTPARLTAAAERGWAAKTMDAANEAIVMGFLWEPSTHVINMTSNTLLAMNEIYERGIARAISRVSGDEVFGGVQAGEVWGLLRGTFAGLRKARHHALDGLDDMTQSAMRAGRSKIDVRPQSISSEAFGAQGGFGKAVDWYGAFIRAPGKALEIEDNLFKMVGFHAELHAQAYRRAAIRGAEEGWGRQQIRREAARLIAEPDEAIQLAAADAALYRTFQQISDGRVMKLARSARDSFPGATLFVPFVRTPINILSYTFERTPFAPLVASWRRQLLQGGAARDIALARMASGTTIALGLADLSWEGAVRGGLSQDQSIREAELRQGYQPDSFQIGQHSIRFSRLDPYGLYAGVIGSLTETLKTRQVDEEDEPTFSQIAGSIAVGTVEAMRNKAWFAGISRLMAAMEDPDTRGQRLLENLVSTALTAPLGGIRELADPQIPEVLLEKALGAELEAGTKSQVMGLLDAIQAQITVLQASLPRRRDLWGKAIESEMVNWFSPFEIKQVTPSPIDQEIVKHGMGILRIRKSGSFEGVPMDFREYPNVYDAYVRMAGNELKIPLLPGRERGAKDTLDAIVSGKGGTLSTAYQELGSPVLKERMVQRIVSSFRALARAEILNERGSLQGPEFDRFRAEYHRRRQARQRALLPGLAP